jgi:hypothetical protein
MKQNLLLTSIKPGPDCDGGIVGVTFTCCGEPELPPTGSGGSSGAQMCTNGEMGGATSCKPYDVWKQYASDACMQQNLVLTGLAPGATCGDGVYQSTSFTCCAPGPGSGMCIAIDDGGPSSCKDEPTWKVYGTDRCAQRNLALTEVKVAVLCSGGASQVTYVCCAP